MRVVCLCGCVLATVNDGTAREMAGLCGHCQKTGDCRTSVHWTEPPAQQAVKPAFKTKDTVEWTKHKGGKNDYRLGR